jgi:hypothetical protein
MYTAIRKLHLYAGLVIFIFLMMYFVTGYVLIHRPWFGGQGQPAREVRTESLAGDPAARTPQGLSSRLSLRGRINVPPQDKPGLRFSVMRPGLVQQVELPADSDTATITTTRQGLIGVLVQLHRVHGYGGGPLWNTFVFFNDLASVSCILFALSGVYLWWKTAQRKIWGVLCLAASCAYGGGMILYLMYA